MNCDAVQGNLPDGFSVKETATYLLKKSAWRINTNVGTAVYNEPYTTPNIFASQVATDSIPLTPPAPQTPQEEADTFETLNDEDIELIFGIDKDELTRFNTYKSGESLTQFSVKRLIAHPYIYKITNCLLSPIPSNPNYAFGATGPSPSTPVRSVNILNNVIPFYYGEGAWKGTINRTMAGSVLSRGGMDVLKESQVANIFDYDSGVFTLYDPDSTR